jgi:hypothetical protein
LGGMLSLPNGRKFRGKHHLMRVVCIKSCSRLHDKTASERSQGLLFLQSFGMLASPLG